MTKGKRRPKRTPKSDSVLDQVAGAQAAAINAAREAAEVAAIASQEQALSEAMAQTQAARLIINDTAHVLGSELTKHGENAETLEVAMRRSMDALHQREFSSDVEPNRTSHVDYWVDANAVQSKFNNGTNNTLSSVLKHLDDYKGFAREPDSYYHIPRDQHEQITRVLSGDTDGLNERSVRALQEKVARIEAESGRPFTDVVKPGSNSYAEVQRGNINQTLDNYDEKLHDKNEELKDDIHAEHEPSLEEGLKTAAMAGVIGGAFGFAGSAARKYFKEKKNIFRGDFTKKDWKDVGLDTAKGAATGFVTGGSVYFLTNYVGASAPVASAFVSTVKGMEVLIRKRRANELSEDAFVDESLLLCSDVAMVTIASAAGQALIPIPVLGALIGSFAGKFACEFLEDKSAAAAEAVRKRLEEGRARLQKDYVTKLQELEAAFLPAKTMMEFAFDIENNRALLHASLTLARMQGVPERKLVKSPAEVVAFLQQPGAGVERSPSRPLPH